MLTLNNLKSPKGTTRNTKRIGRGHGSGWGQQAGKGHKGQKARSGGGVKTGFEGGQMPLYRRLPKRGFLNAIFKKDYAVFNLSQVDKLGLTEVTKEVLLEKGQLKGAKKHLPVKILGNGEISQAVTFKGIEKFSKSAVEKIQKAGGTIEQVAKKETK